MRFRSLIALSVIFCTGASGQINSVLSEGDWYKIGITKSGINSLSYSDLQNAGINPETINPQNLAIFGNGGGMLPQQNSFPKTEDLKETSIRVTGQEDGKFDEGDKIYFYAESPHVWSYNKVTGKFDFSLHLYTDTNFYYLRTSGTVKGKRVQLQAEIAGGKEVSSYNESIHYEKELVNILHSGRYWYGEAFDTTLSRTFSFPASDIVSDSIKIEVALLGKSYKSTSCKVFAGETFLGEIVFDNFGEFDYKPICDPETRIYTVHKSAIQNGVLNIRIEHNKNGELRPETGAMLDNINVFYEKGLSIGADQGSFRSLATLDPGTITFSMPGDVAGLYVWDVTNDVNPVQQFLKTANQKVYFSANGGDVRDFVWFTEATQLKPASIRKIRNQNLHKILEIPDFVIVSHPDFLQQANKLAGFRRTNDQLSVLVTTPEEIYNEFSSGKQDVSAIRDFVKYLYDNSTPDSGLKYLLLFGEAGYDFKGKHPEYKNYVPNYQSRQSVTIMKSYGSDDFFGFLDSDEGYWDETSSGNTAMDIGVGRLPVRNVEEAENIVNKLINYSNESKAGNWPNRVTFIADDNDKNLHINDSEKHANGVEIRYPHLQVQKLYLDYFDQIPSLLPGGERSYSFDNALKKALDEGTLLVNFVGHGGPPSLGNERLMDLEYVDKWKNKILPIFITATCEFALADKPEFFSLGKYIVLKKEGGGIGIFSGTRAAYSSANFTINTALLKYIFNPDYRLGDVVRMTKNNSFSDVYNRQFSFFGDPSLRLDLPVLKSEITSVSANGIEVQDTLTALSKISIKGHILNPEGELASDFNGKAIIEILDRETFEITKGKALGWEDPGPPKQYKVRKNVVSKVDATVVDGLFEAQVILPRTFADTTSLPVKFLIHAIRTNGTDLAAGATLQYKTGGLNTDAPEDKTAPEIKVYLDDVTFTDGDTVSPDPLLVAELFDESGINLSTKDSSDILLSIINSDSTIILNNRYKGLENDFRSGKVLYSFSKLPQGEYRLEFRASDVYLNKASKQISFFVMDTVMAINLPVDETADYTAFPNPFTEEVQVISQNRLADFKTLDVYSMAGIKVRTLPVADGSKTVSWDGTNDSGSKVGKGMYVCKISDGKGGTSKTILVIMQ